ncbi:MAG: universal stress protein [Pseudomonadota bacterium]
MQDKNPILVVVDPTIGEEQVVLKRAKTLALALGRDLELLICYYDQYLGSERFMGGADLAGLRDQMISILRRKLDDFAKPLVEAGIKVEVSVIWDQPLDESIVRFAKVVKPSIVLKETHYHSKISRAIFTHTDWNLIRHCPFPLWLAKSGETDWNPTGDVVGSVDPVQEHDKPAVLDGIILDHVQGLANSLGSTARVFHSWSHPIPTLADGVLMPAAYRGYEIEREIERQHKKALNRLVANRGISDDQVHMIPGSTFEALPEFVDSHQVSLVVMGSVARGRVKRAIIGSTAERVLPMLSCDLLIVKPDWVEQETQNVKPEIVNTSHEAELDKDLDEAFIV